MDIFNAETILIDMDALLLKEQLASETAKLRRRRWLMLEMEAISEAIAAIKAGDNEGAQELFNSASAMREYRYAELGGCGENDDDFKTWCELKADSKADNATANDVILSNDVMNTHPDLPSLKCLQNIDTIEIKR